MLVIRERRLYSIVVNLAVIENPTTHNANRPFMAVRGSVFTVHIVQCTRHKVSSVACTVRCTVCTCMRKLIEAWFLVCTSSTDHKVNVQTTTLIQLLSPTCTIHKPCWVLWQSIHVQIHNTYYIIYISDILNIGVSGEWRGLRVLRTCWRACIVSVLYTFLSYFIYTFPLSYSFPCSLFVQCSAFSRKKHGSKNHCY